jgi:hypothetical protein
MNGGEEHVGFFLGLLWCVFIASVLFGTLLNQGTDHGLAIGYRSWMTGSCDGAFMCSWWKFVSVLVLV